MKRANACVQESSCGCELRESELEKNTFFTNVFGLKLLSLSHIRTEKLKVWLIAAKLGERRKVTGLYTPTPS